MDRIEPAEAPNARGHPPDSQSQSGESSSPPRPPLSTLRSRGESNRTRRPSIRLSRLPSIPSLDTASTQQSQPEEQAGQSHGLSPGWQPTISSPVAEEDEGQAGRRRSNSEPRRGRWSSPSPDVLSRVVTPMRMMPVTEESTQPSPMPPPPQVVDFQPTAEHAEPSPQRPASRNVLRRTSQAALNRFSRNRASTVTGIVPMTSQQRQQTNEYGPQVVDVLDVIGKALALASESVLYGN